MSLAPPRRLRLAAATAVLAALTLVLAACGGSSESGAPSGPAAPQPGFPVTITHAFGQTTIPAKPVRVVTVGYNDADFALALGTVPVGVRDFVGAFDETTRPWAQQALNGARPEQVGGNEIDIEKVAALRPDLILGAYSFMDRATYDTLSRIAPTVADQKEGVASPWQEQTRITGRALGVPDQAEQVVAAVEKRFADARAANPQFANKPVAVDLVASGETNSLGTDDLRTQPFTGLGLQVQPTTEGLSSEQLAALNKDAIAVVGVTEAQAKADPVFANLPAVQAGKAVYLGDEASPFAGALGFGSPLSLPYALDQMVPPLARALA